MSSERPTQPEDTPTSSVTSTSVSEENQETSSLVEEVASPPAAGAPSATRECQYCGETVRADAVTCRFCKRDLYSTNAARMVLPEGEWNTKIPQYMIDEEARLHRQWLFRKKLRRNQWYIVGAILACALMVILWRAVTGPPDPHERTLAVSEPQPTATPYATPTPRPFSVITPYPTHRETPAAISSAPTKVLGEPEQAGQGLAETLGGGVVVPEETDGEAVIVTTADELAAEFMDHRDFAEDKYIGERIRVSGQVKTIDTTGNSPFLLLKSESKVPVKCFLTPASRKELYRIRPGAQVTLRGNCDGAFLEILLSECVFVH